MGMFAEDLGMNNSQKTAYVTVINNANYFLGLKTLIKSIKKTKTSIPIVVLVPCDMEEFLIKKIEHLHVEIIKADNIKISNIYESQNKVEFWNQTFFKLNIARLVQYDKVIYIDADMLVLHNIDSLFSFPSISATTGGKSAHPEWTEFNSGLMVVEPSLELYDSLLANVDKAIVRKLSKGLGYGDQDVFNETFPDWSKDSSFDFGESYNVVLCFIDEYMKVTQQKKVSNINVIHYIGTPKIWEKTIYQTLKAIINCFCEKHYYEIRAILIYLYYMLF